MVNMSTTYYKTKYLAIMCGYEIHFIGYIF